MSFLLKLHELSLVNFCLLQQLNPSLQGLERLKVASLSDQIVRIGAILK